MHEVVNWLENHQLSCAYKKFLGIPCPGCGIQSSIIQLLKGNFYESFLSFPLLIPVLILLVYMLLHLIFKFNKGTKIIKISAIFVGSMLSIIYIISIINIYL